jgi:hypothetical protein
MLPLGHVAYAWGGLRLVQKGAALFWDADYRLVALAAMGPDLSDKALALSGVSRHRTGQVWAHTLFFSHLPVLVATLIFRRRWLPYTLAFNVHLLTDRMWRFPHTLFHPFFGRRFGDWRDLDSVGGMIDAYREVLREDRATIPLELGGIAVLLWLLVSDRLYRPARLLSFLRTGRLPSPSTDERRSCG